MKNILIVCVLVISGASLQAQVEVNNELKYLINKSFGYYPKVKEIENTVTISEDKLTLTRLDKMPDITGDASYAYIRPKISILINGTEFQFAPVNSMGAAINANYALFDFGRLKASIEKSKDELQFSKHNVEYVKAQLANQVSNVYYNIVYIEKAVSIQDSVLRFLHDNKQVVEARLKNGDALKIDLLTIQAGMDNEQNKKVDLENMLQKQFNLLEYTTGIKQNHDKGFDFDLPVGDNSDAALAVAQATNLDFVLAKDKIKQAQSDIAIAKLGNKPVVGLHAATGFKNGYVPEVETPGFNYIAGVSFSIPIYNGGKTKQQVKLAENIVKQNELAIETLNSNYKKDIEQAITDIKSNLERINNTKGQIEQAKYAEQLAAVRFKNGVGTNLELTNASTNLQRAQLTRLQYEYQLCLAKVELARLLGYRYW